MQYLMRSLRRLLSGEARGRASALSLMAPEEVRVFRAWISSVDLCEVSEDHLHVPPHIRDVYANRHHYRNEGNERGSQDGLQVLPHSFMCLVNLTILASTCSRHGQH